MKEILSFGGGVQSTTLLLMSIEGVLPKLDHVIFADTQWEPAAVYAHLEWCRGLAAQHKISIERRTAGNRREDLLGFWGERRSADGKRHASIPAFIKNADGSRGIVRRQCTSTYKVEVIERFVREVALGLSRGQRWPKEPTVRQWLGISEDERRRMKVSQRAAVVMWHPLIEAEALQSVPAGRLFARGFTREDCLRWIAEHGYPQPPRSACIGCPFRRAKEWRELTPAEFEDACRVDEQIRVLDRERLAGDLHGQPYLHQHLIPLREVELGRSEEGNGFEDECAGVCGV